MNLKNIPLSVNFAGIDLIEKGHHNECVENDGEVDGRRRINWGIQSTVNAKQFVAGKNQSEENSELVDCMADDILHHCSRN